MIEIENYNEIIEKICVDYSVKRLELFGSAIRIDFDENKSDIDFLYEFIGTKDMFKRFFGLKNDLENLFKRKIDLLKEDQIKNPYILQKIKSSPRKIIYAA